MGICYHTVTVNFLIFYLCQYYIHISVLGKCQWNSWSSWGSCSATCDGGTRERQRGYKGNCTDSEGSSVDTQKCNEHPCIPPGNFENGNYIIPVNTTKLCYN